MEAVLNITAPIFFLVLVGYLGVRFGLLPKAGLPGLGRFVLYFALPALVFIKLLEMDLQSVLNAQFVAVYAGGGLITSIITIIISRFFFRDSWTSSGVRGIGSSIPNSVFIGFPILIQIYGHPLTNAIAMALVVENIILLPIGLIFVEAVYSASHPDGRGFRIGYVVKRIVTNPIILSVIFGLLGSSVGLKLPAFLDRSLNLLAEGTTSVALIIIGGSLVGVTLKGNVFQMVMVSFTKLLAFPAVVAGLLTFTTGLSPELIMALLVFASVPMFTIYPIIGAEYNEQEFCSSTLMITTILSFFTLSIILHFLLT